MSAHDHTFANPGPAGLIALAMACFAFWAMYTGRVTGDAGPVLAAWMFGGGLVQYAVGWMELRNGEIRGGNVFLFFGAFFMFTNAIGLMVKYLLAKNGLPMDVRIEGYTWIACTIGLILLTPLYAYKTTSIMFLLVCIVDICLILISFMDMGVLAKATYAPPTGWMLFVVGCLGLYVAGAVGCNTHFGKTFFPLPGPVIK